MAPSHLRVCGTKFRDENNREITIHGINVAADAKLPFSPDLPSHALEQFFDGDNVSFVGRPFQVKDAHIHFSRLRRWGYNTIRYIFTWEAIEAAGPGKYDEDWINHTIEVLRIARSYGFYVFMDPHQDVVSGNVEPGNMRFLINPNSGLDLVAAQVPRCGPCMLVA